MRTEGLVLEIVNTIADSVRPLLADPAELSTLRAVVADKGEGHTAHEIDRFAERILFDVLQRAEFKGAVYSEESGLVRLGDEPRVVICDPYCNTTLTFHGLRESAVAAYEYSIDGDFVGGAIADLQLRRVVWAGPEEPSAQVTELGTARTTRPATCSAVQSVNDAFLVVSLLKRRRRADLPVPLLREVNLLTTVDGAIAAARTALGEVDGFVDHAVGQPSYEILAYELVQRAGGAVADGHGRPIDFAEIVRGLNRGEVRRHTIVAAAGPSLRDDILRLVRA